MKYFITFYLIKYYERRIKTIRHVTKIKISPDNKMYGNREYVRPDPFLQKHEKIKKINTLSLLSITY